MTCSRTWTFPTCTTRKSCWACCGSQPNRVGNCSPSASGKARESVVKRSSLRFRQTWDFVAPSTITPSPRCCVVVQNFLFYLILFHFIFFFDRPYHLNLKYLFLEGKRLAGIIEGIESKYDEITVEQFNNAKSVANDFSGENFGMEEKESRVSGWKIFEHNLKGAVSSVSRVENIDELFFPIKQSFNIKRNYEKMLRPSPITN